MTLWNVCVLYRVSEEQCFFAVQIGNFRSTFSIFRKIHIETFKNWKFGDLRVNSFEFFQTKKVAIRKICNTEHW